MQVDDDDGLTNYSTSQLEINGDFYFTADDGLNGVELWKIDGETGDIILVKDIAEGSRGSFPSEFHELDGKLIFTAYIANTGSELWISDGTEGGTSMLQDKLGQDISRPRNLTEFGNEIFFVAEDNGVAGTELWKTDGTTAGTGLVKDIVPGSSS